MEQQNPTLGDDLAAEIARVKVVLETYKAKGWHTDRGTVLLESILRRAQRARESQDPAAIDNACHALRECV